MQRVSQEYIQSMKSPMRNRGYISINFGLINKDLQSSSKVVNTDLTPFSNTKYIFQNSQATQTYGVLEENFLGVDGSTLFLPRKANFLNTGIISNQLVSTQAFELVIQINSITDNFKGLSLEFGENYPTEFSIITDTSERFDYVNNSPSWHCEDVFHVNNSFRVVFRTMKERQSRVRIYSISFGYGLTYGNDSILNSSLKSYASPISKENSHIDFQVTLKNENHYFDVDNPNSAINYFETGQTMDVSYGYQLDDGNIEWIHGNTLSCSGWESDDNSATIYCQDVIRSLESIYSNGVVPETPANYYDLALDVLHDAGIDSYDIDPRLKTLTTSNPIPRVKQKEALQIIANACRCYITQDRFGKILIQPNFIPNVTFTANEQSIYSKASNLKEATEKTEYADLSNDYTTVNGKLRFPPRNLENILPTGFISKDISNLNCTFTKNPILTISMEAVRPYFSLSLSFGESIPRQLIIRSYCRGSLVQSFTETELKKEITISHDFGELDKFEIEFVKTSKPQSRIVLNQVSISNIANFRIGRNEMINSPKIIKQELVKEITVPSYTYQKTETVLSLVQSDVDVASGEVQTFYLSRACYEYTTKLNDDISDGVEIIDSSSFYVTVRFKRTGKFTLHIDGKEYKVVEQNITKKLNNRGKVINWKNPLMGDMNMAEQLAAWLAEHYKSSVEYEYEYRGNPELDILDLIYQDNLFVDNMRVVIYEHTLNFKQAFSGTITARRIEDK